LLFSVAVLRVFRVSVVNSTARSGAEPNKEERWPTNWSM
jgi:hypothetical protein